MLELSLILRGLGLGLALLLGWVRHTSSNDLARRTVREEGRLGAVSQMLSLPVSFC